MAVQAVVFDWGGTLTPWHTIDWGEQWRSYARAYDPGLVAGAVGEVAAQLTRAETAAWQLARDEHRSSTLEAIVCQAGLDVSGSAHRRGVAAYRAFWEPHTYAVPDAVPVLTALRDRGIGVGVLSNTLWPRDHHELLFRRDGLLSLIDAAVYTSEIEWTKPHPEAFRAVLRLLGADPTRSVFVGDRLFDDVYGAQRLGMHAVHVPHSPIPPEERGPVAGAPDAVVQRLADLLALLERWG